MNKYNIKKICVFIFLESFYLNKCLYTHEIILWCLESYSWHMYSKAIEIKKKFKNLYVFLLSDFLNVALFVVIVAFPENIHLIFTLWNRTAAMALSLTVPNDLYTHVSCFKLLYKVKYFSFYISSFFLRC